MFQDMALPLEPPPVVSRTNRSAAGAFGSPLRTRLLSSLLVLFSVKQPAAFFLCGFPRLTALLKPQGSEKVAVSGFLRHSQRSKSHLLFCSGACQIAIASGGCRAWQTNQMTADVAVDAPLAVLFDKFDACLIRNLECHLPTNACFRINATSRPARPFGSGGDAWIINLKC